MFTSVRERRFWIAALVWLAAVYLSLDYVRRPTEFLRGQNLLRVAVVAVLAVSAAAAAAFILRRRPGRRERIALAIVGAVYLVVVMLATERHEERIHFLEYGVLGGLIYAALLERRRNQLAGDGAGWPARWPAATAILMTSAGGWGDEGIQAILPDRVYELRDVALNVGAGVLIVGSMAVLARARRMDRSR